MKKSTIIALLLLIAASPAAAATGLPAVRADLRGEVKADVRMSDKPDRVADRLTDFSTRLERLEVRISALIKRLEAKKVDMTASKTAFADFSAKLDIAQKNLADLSAYINASGGAELDKEQLAAKRKATRQSLQDAHAALKLTVKEISKAIRSIKVDAELKVRADVNASAEAN